jgi:hypothetical protein
VLSVLKVLVQQIDVLAVGRSVSPACDRPVVSRTMWCGLEVCRGDVTIGLSGTEWDCDFCGAFGFTLGDSCSKFRTKISQNQFS